MSAIQAKGGNRSSLDWTASLTGTVLTVEIPRTPDHGHDLPDRAVMPSVAVAVDGSVIEIDGSSALETGREAQPLTGLRAFSIDLGRSHVESVELRSLTFAVLDRGDAYTCVEDPHGWLGTLSGTVSVPAGFDVTQVTAVAYGHNTGQTSWVSPDAEGR